MELMMSNESMIKWKVNSHLLMLGPCDQWCSRAISYNHDPLWLNVKERRCLCSMSHCFD